jgi:hypothetical protein
MEINPYSDFSYYAKVHKKFLVALLMVYTLVNKYDFDIDFDVVEFWLSSTQ